VREQRARKGYDNRVFFFDRKSGSGNWLNWDMINVGVRMRLGRKNPRTTQGKIVVTVLWWDWGEIG
jgi:hypothetical protein